MSSKKIIFGFVCIKWLILAKRRIKNVKLKLYIKGSIFGLVDGIFKQNQVTAIEQYFLINMVKINKNTDMN